MTRAFRSEAGRLFLYLRVTPNASRDLIGGVWRGAEGEERLVVRVTAPPDKDRANRAVLKLVAKTLGLPKSSASITAGAKDRLKTVAIESVEAALIERIETLLSAENGEKSE